MHGHGGDDFVITVPVGTIIRDSSGLILADLSIDDGFAIVCRGGIGGRGNARFATPGNRTPRTFDPGGPEVEKELYLELKLLADVGLLGFPNAGKSTFISTVSGARPRVADYPFTTLVPNLGVVTVEDEESFVIADIPGLVEGASDGVGLGHQFLRHVERCRLLIHLVSSTTYDEPTTDPVERYKVLLHELQVFSPELGRRPQIVVLSKTDACDPEELEEISSRFEKEVGITPMRLSSSTHQGVRQLIHKTWRYLQEADVESEEAAIESSVWD
jgi:GTP-binding protein